MFNVQEMTSRLATMADADLQKVAQLHKADPYMLPLVLGEANRRKAVRMSAAAQQGQPPQGSVVDRKIAEMSPMPEHAGIGQLPAPAMQGMAGGGIVGFSKGGKTSGASLLDEALRLEGVTDPAEIAFIKSLHMQESGGSADGALTSNRGAKGPMQVTDIAFKDVNKGDLNAEDTLDRVRAGVRYARQGLKAAGGDPASAGAYYYGGPTGLAKLQKGVAVSDPQNPGAPDTRQYGNTVAQRVAALLPMGTAVAGELPTATASAAGNKKKAPAGVFPYNDARGKTNIYNNNEPIPDVEPEPEDPDAVSALRVAPAGVASLLGAAKAAKALGNTSVGAQMIANAKNPALMAKLLRPAETVVDAAGKYGPQVLKMGQAANRFGKGLGIGSLLSTAAETGFTPTEDYIERFGLDPKDERYLLGDMAIRARGYGDDLLNNLTFGYWGRNDKDRVRKEKEADAAIFNDAEKQIAAQRKQSRDRRNASAEARRVDAQERFRLSEILDRNQGEPVAQQEVAVEAAKEAVPAKDRKGWDREDLLTLGLQLMANKSRSFLGAVGEAGLATLSAKQAREKQAMADRLNEAHAGYYERAGKASERTPDQIQLLEYLRKNPEAAAQFRQMQQDKQDPKTRQAAFTKWSGDVLLQMKYPNFEDYLRIAPSASSATPAAPNLVSPPGWGVTVE